MRIGVDLGGTKIRVGLIGTDCMVLDTKTEKCLSDGSKMDVVGQIIRMIEEFFSPEVDMIGIGVPAIVDADGVVYDCVNIPSWDKVELKSLIESMFNVPVKVNNDCNCFILGIKASQYGKYFDDIIGITLGTGVGSGLILNGSLYAGKNCGAGEIGGIRYRDKDYEFYCSSQFFTSRGTSGKDAFDAAESGDADAISLWSEFGSNVGELICLAAFAYDPQAIFIGGSIASAYKYFEGAMRERISHFPYNKVKDNLIIKAITAGDFMIVGSVM